MSGYLEVAENEGKAMEMASDPMGDGSLLPKGGTQVTVQGTTINVMIPGSPSPAGMGMMTNANFGTPLTD
ncbi:MAG: hypothetical protein PHV34_07480 [Verrucomicrobiae bacterium]|nr:hypothetical protein [Verrucomicrobiae bacterium]